MYWLAPGKQTQERSRAALVYAIYACGAVVVGVYVDQVYGVSVQGVLGFLYTAAVLGMVAGYVAWRQKIDGPRNILGSPRPPAPQRVHVTQVRPASGMAWSRPQRPQGGMVPAVYTPVPPQEGFGVGPSETIGGPAVDSAALPPI